MRKFIPFLILSIFLVTQNLSAQCGCMSSISIGSLSPNLGSNSTGTMRQGFFSINLSSNYVYGDKYRSGWEEVSPQTVKNFENISFFLQSSYGITNRLSLDMDIGYIARNHITAPPFEYSSSGLNDLRLLGKYNVLYNPRNDFEITIGAGSKIPLKIVSDTNYKYTQTSQGAFAGIYQIFLHKGFKKSEVHLFLVHRGEISVRNSADYLYGPYFLTSFLSTKPISESFIVALELKNEYKLQDENPDQVNFDSGFMNMILSPQLIYVKDYFSAGIKIDFPIVRYYNGSQAGKNYLISLNLGVNTRIF